jgi:hypothetical protein
MSLSASQPFFGLSRAQVQEFYQMLLRAGQDLDHLRYTRLGQEHPSRGEENENVYERAMISLQTKVRFVVLGIHQKPVAILGLERLSCVLSQWELDTLEMEVLALSYDIEVDEANWFVTSEFCPGDLPHLVDKEHADRSGPVLCGCKPAVRMQVVEQPRRWFLLPLHEKEMGEWRGCPACMKLWKAQQACESNKAVGH